MVRMCANCEHYEKDALDYPCDICRDVPISIPDQWEQRGTNCRDTDCSGGRNVEIATAPEGPRNDMEGSAVDMVNRPPHYTHGKYECIDVMTDAFGKEAVQHFCLLNAFKYVWRAEHKNGLEDIKKAWWYLDKYLQLEAKANE